MTKVKRSKKSSGRRKVSTKKRLSNWNKHVKNNFKRLRKTHPGWSTKKILQQLGKTYTKSSRGGKRSKVSKRSFRKRSRSGVKKKSGVLRKPTSSTQKTRDFTKYKFPASWQRNALTNTTPILRVTVP